MDIHPLMRASWVGYSPDPPRTVTAALEEARRTGLLAGRVDEGGFRVSHPVPGRRNSWRPILTGTVRPQGTGSLIEMSLGVHPFVLAFTLVHSLLMFGIGWVMGVVGFSWEVAGAIEIVRAATGVTVEGDAARDAGFDIADPREPGAEAAAPGSLRVRADGDSVTFELRGSGRTRLEADLAWVTVGDARIAWDELEVQHDGATLLLGGGGQAVVIDAEEHRPEDVAWLATWLQARASRRQGTEAERERAARDRQALGQLRSKLEQ